MKQHDKQFGHRISFTLSFILLMVVLGGVASVYAQDEETSDDDLIEGIIAFESTRDGDFEIYVMNADGSNIIQLTDNTFEDRNPGWSPDGSKIVFYSTRDGNAEIYVMDADGENVTRLTNSSGVDEVPVWSPDGSQIVFQSNRDGNYEIYVMNADGSNVNRLTDHPSEDSLPA